MPPFPFPSIHLVPKAVEAQAANDSIPSAHHGFCFVHQPWPFCPDEAVPCAAPTQPRAHPHIAGMEAARRMPSLEYHHFKSQHIPPLVIPIDKQQRLSRQQASFPVEFNLVAVRPPIATPPGAVRCSARAGGQSVGYGYATSASVPLISIRPRLLKHVCRGMATCRRTSRSSACCIRSGSQGHRKVGVPPLPRFKQPHLHGHRHHTEYSVYSFGKKPCQPKLAGWT